MPVAIVIITFFISMATAKAANAARILGFPINSTEPDSPRKTAGKIKAAKTEVGTYLRIFSNLAGKLELLTRYITPNLRRKVTSPDTAIVAQIISFHLLDHY